MSIEIKTFEDWRTEYFKSPDVLGEKYEDLVSFSKWKHEGDPERAALHIKKLDDYLEEVYKQYVKDNTWSDEDSMRMIELDRLREDRNRFFEREEFDELQALVRKVREVEGIV